MFRLPRSSNFLGAVTLLLVFFFQAYTYDYLEIIELRPQSTHMWRKTDCASFALNYYNDGLNPFETRMHNEFNDAGQSIGEGPILYYLVGVAYSIFGPSEIIYRVIWLAIFFAGLLALQQLFFKAFQSFFWSVITPALVFSIPVIAFYAIGFITNVPALAIVFIAWYFFYDFIKNDKARSLWISVLFFFLAGWLKATALISYFALLASGFVYLVIVLKSNIFSVVKKYWMLLLPLVLNAFWYVGTVVYANQSGNNYLSAKIFPIWQMSIEDIRTAVEEFSVLWKGDYLNDQTLWVYMALFALAIIGFWRNRKLFITWLWLFSFLGFGSYVMFFFSAFEHHNYYGISLIFLIPATIFYLLSIFNKDFVITSSIGIISVWLLFQNISLSDGQQDFRYNDWPNVAHVSRDLFDIEEELNKVGVGKNQKVISVPDQSPNISLYLMNRRGLTNFNKLHNNPDSVKKYIQKGYQFAVINNAKEKSQPYIQPFLGEKILTKGEVEVFKLKLD